MLNPFFLQGSKTEQGLIQSLINESIQIHGIDVYYIPRQYVNEKTIIKEVIESEFNNAYPIEAYLNSYEGYDGQGTILSKFGIQELDDVSLIISKERFELYITPLIQNLTNVKLSSRPKEGDLIYFPLGDRLFEIKYVEHEKPFYQLRENYVYELRCELFRYGDEVLDTGINFIDDNVENEGYVQTLTLVGASSTATAIASSVNGGVRLINIVNRGSGYTSAPIVNISNSPILNGNATGIATMISGIVDICEPDGNLLRVQGVEVTNPGFGYTIAPKVVFVGGKGSGAEAVSVIADGVVGIITITNGGSGYVIPPLVSFNSPISGEIAKAVTVIENGSVTQIRLLDAGFGYQSSQPTIQIESPPVSGTGSFKVNEIVVGSSSGSRGRVKTWNSQTNILELSNITGTFGLGELLVGQTSGAEYKLANLNINNTNDPYAQNQDIQIEANSIIDFSEKNPFGTP
jgi:uncharacterized membrane protein